MATVLVAMFPTPDDASKFAGKATKRIQLLEIRRFTILRQFTEFGPTKPCQVRIIWDGTPTDAQIERVEKRAQKYRGTKVKTSVVEVSKQKFLEWLPDHFSIEVEKKRPKRQTKHGQCLQVLQRLDAAHQNAQRLAGRPHPQRQGFPPKWMEDETGSESPGTAHQEFMETGLLGGLPRHRP